MQPDPAEFLRTCLSIQITVLNGPLFRQWAGKGVRRKRQLILTDALLADFGGRIRVPFIMIGADASQPETAEIDQLMKDCFLSFSDDLTARAVSKIQDERAEAIKEMAEMIASAIEARWSLSKRPVPQGHSTQFGSK